MMVFKHVFNELHFLWTIKDKRNLSIFTCWWEYLNRSTFENKKKIGDLVPAKAIPSKQIAYIPFGGKEIPKYDYHVSVARGGSNNISEVNSISIDLYRFCVAMDWLGLKVVTDMYHRKPYRLLFNPMVNHIIWVEQEFVDH